MPDLGEQAISKIAEVGLASQLDEVETLEVSIETNPLKLMSGEVDSVAIDGKGMVMQQDLRVESMQMQTSSIAINPLSVAFGKIELTRPTDAEAQVVLKEADINRAFNSDFIQDKLKNLPVTIESKPAIVDAQNIQFRLPGNGKLSLSADLRLHETGDTKQVSFTAVPKMADNGQRIALEQIEVADRLEAPEVTQALVQQAQALLDLSNFELDGMTLQLKSLDVQPGAMTLRAHATIAQFPDAS